MLSSVAIWASTSDFSKASIAIETLARFGVIDVMVSRLADTSRMTGLSSESAGAGFSPLERGLDVVGDGKSPGK
jgi:hypothetical protein